MSKRQINTDAIIDNAPDPVDPIEGARQRVIELFRDEYESEEYINPIEILDNLIKVVDENAIHQIREEISVYYPEQLFSPIPYMSYRCGNLWYKTVMLPGETREEAYDRAFTYLRAMVTKQFEECRREFWERQKSMQCP